MIWHKNGTDDMTKWTACQAPSACSCNADKWPDKELCAGPSAGAHDMSTDRRYAILHRMMWGARQTLEALDAADREAGYLRLKVDDAAVEKVARVLAIRAEGYDDPAAWGELSDAWRESYRDDARAVLAALRETP